MTPHAIQLELLELHRRVAALEARLGVPSCSVEVPKGDGLTGHLLMQRELLTLRRRVQALEERLGADPAAVIGEQPAAVAAEVPATPPEPDAPSDLAAQAAPQEQTVPVVAFDAAISRLRPGDEESATLERLVGGKWFGWIGSIAVVIGVGLLMKYGYEQRWFSVSPTVRCLTSAAFGLLLVGVGELVRKRMNVVAAAGILAAGVGTVYASAFAAYRLYDLLTEVPGMLLLALCAGLGIAVGVRSRLISVTALSLVGGYLAPFIIPGRSIPAVMPVFLLTLMLVGLVIAARMGGKFRALRSLVWWATLILGGSWLVGVGVHHATLSLVFIGLVWAGIHGELVYEVRRSVGTVDEGTPLSRIMSWRPVVSSFSTTAWCTVLGVLVLEHAGTLEWLAPAALFAITAMLWTALAGTLETLRERPRNDAERLGAAMFAQAAGLLVVTLALALSPRGEVISWTVLALSAVVAGRWLRLRALDIYAVVVLAITTVRVLAAEALSTRGAGTALGFVVTDWTAMTTFVGGAWVAASFIVTREGERWTRITNAMAGIGVSTAALGLLSARADDFTFPVIFGTAAIGAAVLSYVRRSRGLSAVAWVWLMGSLPGLLKTEWWSVRTSRGVELLGLRLEPIALCLVWVAVAAWLVVWLSGRHWSVARRGVLWPCGAAIAVLFALGGAYHDASSLSSVCLAWLAITAGVSVLAQYAPGRRLEFVALGALLPVSLMWVAAFAVQWTPSSAPFVLHPGLGVAGLIVLAWWWTARCVRRTESQVDLVTTARIVPAIAIGLLGFAATSLEVARIAAGITADPAVRGGAVSMWWGVLAIALVGLGFWRRVQAVRWTGLGVLGIAMIKAVFFDLQSVPQLWRIVSFIGLGLMMLVVPVVYSRMSHVLRTRRDEPGTLGA